MNFLLNKNNYEILTDPCVHDFLFYLDFIDIVDGMVELHWLAPLLSLGAMWGRYHRLLTGARWGMVRMMRRRTTRWRAAGKGVALQNQIFIEAVTDAITEFTIFTYF